MTLVEWIASQMHSDDTDDSHKLRHLYEQCSAEEKDLLDSAFTYLCGYSLKTATESSEEE